MDYKRYQLDENFCICECQGDFQEAITIGQVSFPFKMQRSMVLICMQGRVSISINLRDYILHRQDMMVVSENDIIQSIDCSPDAQTLLCFYRGDYYIEEHIDNTLTQQQYYMSPVSHICDEDIEEVVTIFRLIAHKIEEHDNPYRKKAVKGYIQVLMSLGYNNLSKLLKLQEKHTDSRAQQVFHQFLTLVQHHYREHHTIKFYADQICLTPKYLSQLVQQASGRLAGDWIIQYLLLEAKAMLANHEYSIMEISEALHFSSPSAFIAFFKKHTRTTPKKYSSQ